MFSDLNECAQAILLTHILHTLATATMNINRLSAYLLVHQIFRLLLFLYALTDLHRILWRASVTTAGCSNASLRRCIYAFGPPPKSCIKLVCMIAYMFEHRWFDVFAKNFYFLRCLFCFSFSFYCFCCVFCSSYGQECVDGCGAFRLFSWLPAGFTLIAVIVGLL